MEFLRAALPWITVGLCILVIVINHIKSKKDKQSDKEAEGNYMTEGMCLGLCVGLAFGLGHILNLLNGVNENIIYQLLQIAGAIATGFLLSIIFFKSGSLLPCIITHVAIDMCSAFANQSDLTEMKMTVICLINMAVTVAFTVYLLKHKHRFDPASEKNSELEKSYEPYLDRNV